MEGGPYLAHLSLQKASPVPHQGTCCIINILLLFWPPIFLCAMCFSEKALLGTRLESTKYVEEYSVSLRVKVLLKHFKNNPKTPVYLQRMNVVTTNGYYLLLPWWLSGKEHACKCRRFRRLRFWFLGWEDPLEEERATHSQYSCLEDSMDRGAWRSTVREFAKSWTQLRGWTQLSTAVASRAVQ